MTPFSLGPACTLSQAEAIHAALSEHLLDHAGEGLLVDASAVEEADISLVQILVSAGRTAASRHLAMTLEPSPAVTALLARAGLDDWAASLRA
ncbi:STAS domain-containing protein [Aureimonas phyllosphaerae]|uniref:Anti-anti-sigma regulatory factor n=1 Tax=Aureimonas phyllosphaerae TaxID=1166078 RepID=A0A7W6FUM5_9HYPH|nr:STAS domain-containing protein [Aureimonas phyllosphaerae]MBB3936243.1 anti-anti-sigma regulatory factor [Aureimonas phyllosphaerae]MBB3960032.1 anti-anti-sigma regulatory factor [Aureimonas phyllosphaerae]SFF32510.1 STAS domain-containing protein [Aureimonas phyllosphaerae]